MQNLVDPAREGYDPAPPGELALDRHLELRVEALREHLGPQLVVPVRAELRPPDAAGAADRADGADREVGEVADAHARPALVEVEFHGMMISVLGAEVGLEAAPERAPRRRPAILRLEPAVQDRRGDGAVGGGRATGSHSCFTGYPSSRAKR